MSEELLLKNQICFPVYAASRLITRVYQPLLDDIGLTYPQYLTMLTLWEKDKQSIGEIGKQLYLNTNTLTPLINKLKEKKLLTKKRSEADERTVYITLTDQGRKLKEKAACIPQQLLANSDISEEKLNEAKQFLWGFLEHFDNAEM